MINILCIDDQIEGLAIRRLLLETKGYSVQTADSGQSGLRALADTHFSAVVLDYSMPDLDGEEVVRQIKSRWPSLPVIMLSGYPEVPESAMAAADAFIVKGSAPKELLDALEQLTGDKPLPRTTATVERSRNLLARTQELLSTLDHRHGQPEAGASKSNAPRKKREQEDAA
jgi:CheY-like chemotaxis protein